MATKEIIPWWKRDTTTKSSTTTYTGGGRSSSSYYYDEDDYWDYGSYKRSKYRSSMGWGSGRLIDTTSHYIGTSSSIWKKATEKEKSSEERDEKILLQAYKATRDMVVILDFPYQVDVRVSADTSPSTPGARRIFVPTTVLNTTKSDKEKIDIFCGIGIHEASHLKFTEYKIFRAFENKVRIAFPEFTDPEKDLIKSIANFLEDERIEDKLLSERPGYFDFISVQKDWMYESLQNKITKTLDTKGAKFYLNLFRLIRFQDKIEKDVLEKYSDIYSYVESAIHPLPQSTKECCSLAVEIVKEMKKLLAEISKTDHSFKKSLSDVISAVSSSYEHIEYGIDGDSGTTTSCYEKMANTIKSNDYLSMLIEGNAERGESRDCYFEKPKGNEGSYRSIVKKIKKYIPSIRKIIKGTDKNYDFNIYGCRHGILDTNKLAEAYQGVPQVYVQQGHVRTNRTTVCVLVDESGSMYGDKERLAREAATLLNESLGPLPGVDLYIYGHSADEHRCGDINLRIYREGSKYVPKFAISDIQGRDQNRDGDAIYEVAKRVRKFTSSHCIFFVISDGCPYAGSYYGTAAIRDVHDKVKKVEKLDFDVIQVSIDYVSGVEKMFDNYIDIRRDLSELPSRLGKIIKKSILSDKKTTVTTG